MASSPQITLALDVGIKRIGVARGVNVARLATPLTTLEDSQSFVSDIAKLVDQEQADLLVVGRPINSAGESTNQTEFTAKFVDELKKVVSVPIVWQDESLTSVKAEKELDSRGKAYTKADIDALAATYILEDYFTGLRN